MLTSLLNRLFLFLILNINALHFLHHLISRTSWHSLVGPSLLSVGNNSELSKYMRHINEQPRHVVKLSSKWWTNIVWLLWAPRHWWQLLWQCKNIRLLTSEYNILFLSHSDFYQLSVQRMKRCKYIIYILRRFVGMSRDISKWKNSNKRATANRWACLQQ